MKSWLEHAVASAARAKTKSDLGAGFPPVPPAGSVERTGLALDRSNRLRNRACS